MHNIVPYFSEDNLKQAALLLGSFLACSTTRGISMLLVYFNSLTNVTPLSSVDVTFLLDLLLVFCKKTWNFVDAESTSKVILSSF